MKKLNLKSGLTFAPHLALVAVFTVIFFGLIIAPANAAADGWHIKDDATGGECAAIGNWDAGSKTCTLSQDLNQRIIIDSDNITLDGNGRTITGSNTGNGVYLSGKTGVTIKNLNVKQFSNGIFFYQSSGNTLTNNTTSKNNDIGIFLRRSSDNTLIGNTASNNGGGIFLLGSNNNTLTDNTANSNSVGIYLDADSSSGPVRGSNNNILKGNIASNNSWGIVLSGSNNNTLTGNATNSNRSSGIRFEYSSNNTLTSNIMLNNQTNFHLNGASDSDFENNIGTSNTVDGKPIYYVKNAINQVYDSSTNAGTFYCIKCDNVTIRDLTLTKNGSGVFLWKTTNSKVENVSVSNNISGVALYSSSNNTITKNTALNNSHGIYLHLASNNNQIIGNISSNNKLGIWFDGSNSNTLTDSTIESSSFDGIRLSSSSDNIITNNVILNNSLGISFGPPTNSTNKIYNNNFVNNSTQIFIGVNDSGSNVFNLATPTGGNYWSNYDTPAEGCNDTNNDGFCDLPFFTGGPGKDNLPWTKKDGWLAPLNNPPTLSFPETGLYAGDGIDPNAGDTSTQFTFKVIYTDADNDPPSFINTFLFGHATTTIPMSVDTTAESALHDGNYANGEQYVSFWKREVVGLHYYTSEASDGSSAVRFPELPNVAGFPLEIKKPFTHKVALIPVRYIGEPSPFHSIGELKGKAVSVNEYYNQQSYGAVNIDIQFASDEWLLLDKRLEDYTETSNWWEKWERIREDAIQLSGINVDDYDAVIVIQPACMRSFANEIGGKKIITTEKDPYGVWAHELGHTSLFKFYDYYEETDYALSHGEIGNWGLMGRATLMNPTSPIMSANKVKAGWLQFNTISADGYGLYDIDFLTGLNSGGQANRYATKGGNTSYYIFEGRGPVDNVSEDYLMPSDGYCGWPYDYKLSEDKGVQLYKVTRGVNQLSGEPKIYSVPHPIMFLPDSWNKVTLTPSKSYIDEEAEVKFTAIEENGQFKIKITNFTPVKKKIISLINIFFESTLPSVIPEPLIAEENFDFDLHVSTPDGKMVGMDYQTQNYINQIEGVTTSGNIPGGGPEWISVPDDTFVYYTIDTTPAQKWSAETGVSIGKIFTTWQVITYDGLGQRQESSPIATEIELGAESALALKAEVNIDPSTINLNSSGKWITAYIELPQPYDVRKIKLDTVFLNRFIIAEQDQKYGFVKKPEVIDHDKDGIPELVVKFDRGRVIKMIGESSDQKRNTTRQQLELSGEVFYNQVPIPFSGEYQVVIKRSNP